MSLTVFTGDHETDVDDTAPTLTLHVEDHEPVDVLSMVDFRVSAEQQEVKQDIRTALFAFRALIRYETEGRADDVLQACRGTTMSHVHILLHLDESIGWADTELRLHFDGSLPVEPMDHNLPTAEIADAATEFLDASENVTDVDAPFDIDALRTLHDTVSVLIGDVPPESAFRTPGVEEGTWYSAFHDDGDDDPNRPAPHAPVLARAA